MSPGSASCISATSSFGEVFLWKQSFSRTVFLIWSREHVDHVLRPRRPITWDMRYVAGQFTF